MSALFDKTIQGLATSANMRLLRQNLTSSNIANAETPEFHAKKLDFEEALARSLDLDGLRTLSTSHPEHIPVGGGSLSHVRPEIYDNPDVPVNSDGNTVNLEREMSALAENTVLYRAAVQLINKKLGALKYAVTEGR
ncbi:MAG: flagellar basal body rod protein FlgB [Bdellovibrio sp.]|nr:MAG: flagellar basal body rod protein FlgB [Bdellovibrio sp.]